MPSETLYLISAEQDENGLLCCVKSLQCPNEEVKFRGLSSFLIIPAYSQLWKGRKAVAQKSLMCWMGM